MFTSTVEMPGGVTYFASYLDYPSDIVAGVSQKTLLDRVRTGHLNGRTLRRERRIGISGHPARELIAETPDGIVLVIRSAYVAPRLYQWIVEGRPGVEDDPDTLKYLDSFSLR
jgi:hypothetical protein